MSAINEIINNIYPRSFYIPSPLIIQLEEEDAQLEKLTEQQYFALDMLSSHKRVAINGCAGSGKTFLAVEQARRLALRDDKVLLTCFNRNLANWLKQLFQKKAEIEAALENVTVSTFHQLNSNLLRQAERRGILPSTGYRQTNINSDPYLPDVDFQTPRRNTFQDSYDERLVPIIPLLGVYYDAIIVDEGQDFDDKWWILLQALLRSKEESLLYVFYDENQIISRNGRSPTYPIPSEHHYPLPFNCCTTKKIHEAIVKYVTIGKPPACKPESPEGQEIENIKVGSLSEDGRTKLVELLNRLIHKEKIPLEDIVLLTPFGKDKSYFKEGLAIDKGIMLSWNMDTSSSKHNVLTCSSISAFKGLERKVVILAEADQIWDDKLWYVALSRAKELLIILETDPFLPDLPDDLP
jgi:superfamily I DNA and RNA helicase